jgi:DNA (cytosine-5)-methyltransferase 1
MRVFGLFAGIGGFEQGLREAGHETSALCEIEPAAQVVLEERFPGVQLYSDIRNLKALPPNLDLVSAGFPCQDLSQVGRAVGISGVNSGLVTEVFRLIEQSKPSSVLLENVPFMVQLAKGHALRYLIDEFQRLGYDWAYRIVDSNAFGLPQRRRRVFLLASKSIDPRSVLLVDDSKKPASEENRVFACGFYWTEGNRGLGWAVNAVPTLKGGSGVGIPSPPAILLTSQEIVKPDIRDAERLQGFPADWTVPALAQSKRHGVRWKLVGNAVTVNVAAWLGENLQELRPYQDLNDTIIKAGDPWPTAAYKVGNHPMKKASVSDWPICCDGLDLDKFLIYPLAPLSLKAARGFLSRLKASSLRRPPGLIEALEKHVQEGI